jgi:hypothetical protein
LEDTDKSEVEFKWPIIITIGERDLLTAKQDDVVRVIREDE